MLVLRGPFKSVNIGGAEMNNPPSSYVTATVVCYQKLVKKKFIYFLSLWKITRLCIVCVNYILGVQNLKQIIGYNDCLLTKSNKTMFEVD